MSLTLHINDNNELFRDIQSNPFDKLYEIKLSGLLISKNPNFCHWLLSNQNEQNKVRAHIDYRDMLISKYP